MNTIKQHVDINLHISKKLFCNICFAICISLWYWFGLYYWQEEIKDSVNYALIPFFSVVLIWIIFKGLLKSIYD